MSESQTKAGNQEKFKKFKKDLVDLLSSVKPVLTRILPSPVLVIEWTNLDLNGSVSSF